LGDFAPAVVDGEGVAAVGDLDDLGFGGVVSLAFVGGVGVERTFPVHSPILAQIEVVTRGDVRRAKLYYLRDRIGKSAKIKEKRTPTGTHQK